MPTLSDQLPNMSPKSLIRRETRSQRVAQVERISMPAQSLIQLRAAQVGLYKDFTKASDPAVRVSIVGAMVKVIEMRRVLLKIPGPSREPVKSGPTIRMPVVYTDIEPSSPG